MKRWIGYLMMAVAIALFFAGDLIFYGDVTTPLTGGETATRHTQTAGPFVAGFLFFIGIVFVVMNRPPVDAS